MLWEISAIPKKTKKKESEEVAKFGVTSKHKEGLKNPNAIQMSLANTGLVKKKPKMKTQGKFVPSSEISKTTKAEPTKEEVTEILLKRRRSASSPNLITESEKWQRRPGSGSPIISRPVSASCNTIEYYPGSFGRVAPHPHHFDHPEKYVDGIMVRSGLIRARSSSMTNLVKAGRPKTPPSPHHHDHPLKTLPMQTNSRPSSPKSSLKGKTKQTDIPKATSITWQSEMEAGPSSWDQNAFRNAKRQENDRPILRGHYQPLVEKKKGDYIHTPLQRVRFDISPFFIDSRPILGYIVSGRKHLSNCLFQIQIDSPLLSIEQRNMYLDYVLI